MDELVRWLGGQLDADAVEAEDALKRTTTTRRRVGGEWVEDTVQPPEWRRSVWDPARVLREIDAKRRIVERYAWLREHGDTGGTAWVLPLLALPYADRPGYREEWAP